MIEVINEIRQNLFRATNTFVQRINSTRGMYGIIGLNLIMLIGSVSLLITLPISASIAVCSIAVILLCTGLSTHVIREHLAIKKNDVVFSNMITSY